jgi:hypothetical protein
MHQPTYYPGETVVQTEAAGHFSFSLFDVHNQRLGPYTNWPRDAIEAGQDHLPFLGAQVSFSGSLIENLNALESAGVNGGMWNNWDVLRTGRRPVVAERAGQPPAGDGRVRLPPPADAAAR